MFRLLYIYLYAVLAGDGIGAGGSGRRAFLCPVATNLAPGGIPKANALPITDKTAKEYAFTDQAPKDMKYFRLEIINTWSNERNHSMQLAEFQFNYDDLSPTLSHQRLPPTGSFFVSVES